MIIRCPGMAGSERSARERDGCEIGCECCQLNRARSEAGRRTDREGVGVNAGPATKAGVQCHGHGAEGAAASRRHPTPPRKIRVITCDPYRDRRKVITLFRTDTTLDLSQKAEKGMNVSGTHLVLYDPSPTLGCGPMVGFRRQKALVPSPPAPAKGPNIMQCASEQGECSGKGRRVRDWPMEAAAALRSPGPGSFDRSLVLPRLYARSASMLRSPRGQVPASQEEGGEEGKSKPPSNRLLFEEQEGDEFYSSVERKTLLL
jgi:hypothetical protein